MTRWRRREVVKTGLGALAALPMVAFAAEGQQVKTSASGPFLVRDGESRAKPPVMIAGHPFAATKVGAKDVQGRFAFVVIDTPPGRGPELHVHLAQNELFFVLRGSVGLKCGEQSVVLKMGDSFLAPLGIAHAFVALGREPSQMINMFEPAGQIEAFFVEYAEVLNQSDPPDLKRLTSVNETHGIRVVGPPLRAADFLPERR